MDKFGILAGKGILPLESAKGIKANGLEPVIVGIKEEVEPYLEEAGFSVTKISLGEVGKILSYFREQGVDRLLMVGRVGKRALFSDLKIDADFQHVLAKLPIKNTDAILLAVVDYFEEQGIKVEAQTKFLDNYLPKRGLLTNNSLTLREKQDIEYGFKIAREIGRLDIGQSVVVKSGVILAVESMEGTDRTILRGAELGGEGIILIKAAKPEQDMRFDVPVIGLDTLETLIKKKARVLAVEADLTIILNKEKMISKAEENGLSIVAVDENSIIDK